MLFTASRGRLKAFFSAGLLLLGVTACANRDWSDWSRVQAVQAETRTEVQLHEDAAPWDNRKIKGRLHSVTDDSITLQLKDGRQRTVHKHDVQRVGIRKPFSKLKLLLRTLATIGELSYLVTDGPNAEFLALTIPTGVGLEAWKQLQMRTVYEAGSHQSDQRDTGND